MKDGEHRFTESSLSPTATVLLSNVIDLGVDKAGAGEVLLALGQMLAPFSATSGGEQLKFQVLHDDVSTVSTGSPVLAQSANWSVDDSAAGEKAEIVLPSNSKRYIAMKFVATEGDFTTAATVADGSIKCWLDWRRESRY